MESLLHALSAVKTCVQVHGTGYQKEAFDSIFKALGAFAQQTNNAMVPCRFHNAGHIITRYCPLPTLPACPDNPCIIAWHQ